MEKLIHRYLDNYYTIDWNHISKTFEIFLKGNDETVGNYETFPETLVSELEMIFGVSKRKLKSYIKIWVNKKKWFNITNVDIRKYWKKKRPWFPIAKQIFPRTIASDLVSVQPLQAPSNPIWYFDMVSSGSTEPNTNGRIYQIVDIKKSLKIW